MSYVNVVLVSMSFACIIYIIRRQIFHKNSEIFCRKHNDVMFNSL